MPLFKAGTKIVHFAHVPKCAGSSMEKYLRDRFGVLAFHESDFHMTPEDKRWSRTSPQHVDHEIMYRLFPGDFIDMSFAIVRHPLPRLISAFHFQLEVERKLPANMDFSSWIEEIKNKHLKTPFPYDNHIRPMDDIVPQGAKVFHIENGLDEVIDWLDETFGPAEVSGAIERLNERGTHGSKKMARATPTPDDIKTLSELYAKDFERFGYDPQKWKGLSGTGLATKIEKPGKFSLKKLVNGLGFRG